MREWGPGENPNHDEEPLSPRWLFWVILLTAVLYLVGAFFWLT